MQNDLPGNKKLYWKWAKVQNKGRVIKMLAGIRNSKGEMVYCEDREKDVWRYSYKKLLGGEATEQYNCDKEGDTLENPVEKISVWDWGYN